MKHKIERRISMKNVTNDFKIFMEESNGVGQAFMSTVMKISEVSALEP